MSSEVANQVPTRGNLVGVACTWEAVPQLQRQQRRDAGAEAVAAHHQLPPLPLDSPLHDGRRVLAPLVALKVTVAVPETGDTAQMTAICRLPSITPQMPSM